SRRHWPRNARTSRRATSSTASNARRSPDSSATSAWWGRTPAAAARCWRQPRRTKCGTEARSHRERRAKRCEPAAGAFLDQEAGEVGLIERRSAVETLELVAALRSQQLELLLVLHALGDHAHLEAVGHGDDRAGD